METGILHLHNILRWVILILLFASIMIALTGWLQKKVFRPAHRRVWLFTLIFSHLMFLVGLYLLVLGRYGILKADLPEGTSIMKNGFFRFFWVEHPLLMLIALILVTIGNGMAKKPLPDATKFRKAFWFFLIAMILILVSIPWPGRELVGRPLFPGI